MVGRTVSHNGVLVLPGSGGMGTVCEVEDARFGRRVALQSLTADLACDRGPLGLFQTGSVGWLRVLPRANRPWGGGCCAYA